MNDPRIQPYIDKLQRGEELTSEELTDYRNIMSSITNAPQDAPWEAPTALDTASDAVRGAYQGITFGFGDELLGGIGGIANIFGEGGVEAGYKDVREGSRKLDRKAQENSPTAFTVGEIGGAVGSALLTPQVLVGKAAGVGGKALGMAAQGAAEGAVYSAGKSEEDVTSLGFFKDMGEGALFGGLAGGAIPLVKPVASKLKSGVTSLIPQVARLKIFAGLDAHQANMYKEYLDDITKYANDTEGLKEAIEAISDTSKDLKILNKQAKVFYDAAKKEVVNSPTTTFMNMLNQAAKKEGLDKKAMTESKQVEKLFGKIFDLPDNVTGDVLHKLRKEADELIKWDRKNSLSIEGEQLVKATRNILKDMGSPSTKAGDMIYKVGIPIKQVKNQLIDKHGKPKGFLNRLEQGKLNEGEVEYVRNKFRTIGERLQDAVSDLSASGVVEENLKGLKKVADALELRDFNDQELFDKAYKFIEFQKTGSLRDLSKMVKIGTASTFLTPLVAPLVAAVDAPSSTLKGLLQLHNIKKAVIPTAAKGVAKVSEAIPDTKMSKLKNIKNAAEELRGGRFAGASDEWIQEGEEAIKKSWDNLGGTLDDVNQIERSARSMSKQGVDSIEAGIRKAGSNVGTVLKELPETAVKVDVNQPDEIEEWAPDMNELEEWVPEAMDVKPIPTETPTPTPMPTKAPTVKPQPTPQPTPQRAPIKSDYVPYTPPKNEKRDRYKEASEKLKKIRENAKQFGVK